MLISTLFRDLKLTRAVCQPNRSMMLAASASSAACLIERGWTLV
jgi:hypothetical protein